MKLTTMKKFSFLMATGLVIAGTTFNLHAATSGPFYSTVPSTLTDWSQSLVFPQFNPALGTLVSVELDLTNSFTTTLYITNNADSSSSGTAKTEVTLTVT